jgi:hypothetical protein
VKVNAYPADVGGCGSNRIIWPGEALAAQGADVAVIRADDAVEQQVQAIWIDTGDEDRRVVDVIAPDADIVVLQRPLTDTLVEAIRILRKRGVRVVVEVDDDFEALNPKNVSWRAVHPRTSPRRNWRHLAEACRIADWVVVSTPTLAKVYGSHGRCSVVRNCVPAHYLDDMRPWHDGVWVGWTGSTKTHPDDLQVTRGAIRRALAGTEATFAVVGEGGGVKAALDLAEPPRASGWQEIDIYPQMVAELDVGIVPLEESRFNEAKSALKLMEFSALGVAAVASPTSENMRMTNLGVGMIARTPRQWEGIVRRLIVDEAFRFDVAARSREAMRPFTYEARCGEWLDAWTACTRSPSRKKD